MSRIQELEHEVKRLYYARDPKRADWADWLVDNHVIVVADNASELAKKYGANEELARAAALLHDIADVKMQRSDEGHEAESLRMARELMIQFGLSEVDIKLVVDDAIHLHSCHGDKRPKSIEGKILATADSLAHLKTDFYIYAAWAMGKESSLHDVKAWTLQKIERDYNNKILFEDERKSTRPDYELIKNLFSR